MRISVKNVIEWFTVQEAHSLGCSEDLRHWTLLVITQNIYQQRNLLGNEQRRAVDSIKREKRLPLK